jgi:hypothetical protein
MLVCVRESNFCCWRPLPELASVKNPRDRQLSRPLTLLFFVLPSEIQLCKFVTR